MCRQNCLDFGFGFGFALGFTFPCVGLSFLLHSGLINIYDVKYFNPR